MKQRKSSLSMNSSQREGKKKNLSQVPLSKSPSFEASRVLSDQNAFRINIFNANKYSHTLSIFVFSFWIPKKRVSFSSTFVRTKEKYSNFFFFPLSSETERIGRGGGEGGVNEAENFTRGKKHMAPRCCVRVVRFRVFAKAPQTPSYFFNVPSRRY